MNGRNSFTGKSRHIYIKYFLIKDQVDKGEIRIMYCPTHLMLADYFTKPLTGALFHKLRDIIMERVSPYTLLEDIVSYSIKGGVVKHTPLKEIP